MRTLRLLLFLLLSLPPVAFSATVNVSAGDDVQAALDGADEGDTIVFGAGTYREQMLSPKSNQVLAMGSDVILKGSKILDSFTVDGANWYASGQTQGTGTETGSCLSGYRCGVKEELFIDGVRQRHMTSLVNVVAPGQWYFDYAADRIYMSTDPTGKLVETSTASAFAFGAASGVNGVRISCKGAIIEQYASPSQNGVIRPGATTPGEDWEVSHCTIRDSHGAGIQSFDGWKVWSNVITNMGQIGAIGNGEGAVWYDNEIYNNNRAGFSPGWEAGGTKFAETTDYQFLGNLVHTNSGPGIWFDISNTGALIDGNTVYDNGNDGIFWEISGTCTIRGNHVYGNGLGFQEWLFGAQIAIRNGEGCLVEKNTVVVPVGFPVTGESAPHGIIISCQDRGAQWTCNNNIVQDNIIRYLGGRGASGAGDDWTEPAGFYTTNIFRRNVYLGLSDLTDHWVWNGTYMNFTEWLAATSEAGAIFRARTSIALE